MPSVSPYWITAPIGLAMILWVVYEIRRQKHFSFTYAYGLALESLHLGRDENNPSGAALQLGLVLKNAADGPLRYNVEQFDVIIGNTTLAQPIFTNRGVRHPARVGYNILLSIIR